MFKPYKKDRFLYHFTKSETAIKYILKNQELRFSPYTKTNDPYETKSWSITIKDLLEEYANAERKDKKSVCDLMTDFNGKRHKYIENIKSKVKTMCFSEDIIDFGHDYKKDYFGYKLGWGYPTMWSHYGENHKGVCLMLDKNILSESIKNGLSDNFDVYKGSVSYTNQLIKPQFNEIDFEEVKFNGIEKSIISRIENNINHFFFQKVSDWESEREFRFILIPKKEIDLTIEEYLKISIKKSLKVIIVGEDIELENEMNIEQIAKDLNIRLYKMSWSYSNPMIDNGPYLKWSNNIRNPFL